MMEALSVEGGAWIWKTSPKNQHVWGIQWTQRQHYFILRSADTRGKHYTDPFLSPGIRRQQELDTLEPQHEEESH